MAETVGATPATEPGTRLTLPSDDPDAWAHVEEVLRGPMDKLSDLDAMLTRFSALDREPRVCTFFAQIPGSAEATMQYYDFDRRQSHNVVPLSRKLRHLSVGQLWAFVREITGDLQPANMSVFCARMREIATGKLQVPK